MSEVKNVPESAFKLKASKITFNQVEGEDAETYEITMLARSSGAIEHWFWGDQVVHDMAGMQVGDKIPIDFNHEPEVIGYLDKFEQTAEGLQVTGKLVSFQPDDRAAEIAFKAKNGIPWQASINFGGDGIEVEQVAEGITTQANGREFTGPATVIRSWPLRGVAVTPYGADAGTESTVLNDDGEHAVKFFNQGDQEMADTTETVVDENQAEEVAENCDACGQEIIASDENQEVETAQESDELENNEPENDDEQADQVADEVAETDAPAEVAEAAALNQSTGKRFVELFGNQGALWFIDGKTEEECFALHTQQLAEQLHALKEENETLRNNVGVDRGEDAPLAFSNADVPQTEFNNRIKNYKDKNLTDTAAFFAARFDKLND